MHVTENLKTFADNKMHVTENSKTFADNKMHVTENLNFVLWSVENNVGKGEHAGYHFQKLMNSFSESLQVGIVW